MRIIGGEARSRTLIAPKGMETRPTLDQVRESLFNILQMRIEGAKVLDLYAGSGALALEALSRGAESAVLCDMSREACSVIRRNIDSLHYQERATLYQTEDKRALDLLEKSGIKFDLIFLDPPYRMDTSVTIDLIVDKNLLAPGGLIIVEHDEKMMPNPKKITCIDRRKYRATNLSFYGRDDGE